MTGGGINGQAAAIAVTRFGLGARPGEIEAASRDPRGWLLAQIRREGADQPIAAAGASLPSSRDRMQEVAAYRDQVKAVKQESGRAPAAAQNAASGMTEQAMMTPTPAVQEKAADAVAPGQGLKDVRKMLVAPIRDETRDEIVARAQLAATTPASFRERWTLFWANHFTVAAKNLRTAALVGAFEREAIRPHVFGRFAEMLTASSTHPGMLLYLDQAQSAGPNSLAGQRRRAGLNENLAREILELHTVGADAGYTQADVTEFARALTGFSIGAERDGPDRMGAFLYRVNLHEPGQRSVMGRRYSDEGARGAGQILADLAASPKTADHLARKLATHFVADAPPPALVARLSANYQRTGGDLGELARTLVEAPEAWRPEQAKLKTPYEFIVSGYRAAGAAPQDGPREVIQPLTAMGHRPFAAPQPNGWSDQGADWAAPDAMVKRLSWASNFAARYAPPDAPVELAKRALGERVRPATLTALARAETRPEAFALLLMSPEFQRR